MTFFLKDYSYSFPAELIARYPANQRDESRLLVLNKTTGATEHTVFKSITDYFKAGDVLVFNDSKVFPCRLVTKRKSGGRQEILLLGPGAHNANWGTHIAHRTSLFANKTSIRDTQLWTVLINANRRVHQGDRFDFDDMSITILDDHGAERNARIDFAGDLMTCLEKNAHIPLPPYINRATEAIDTERYQTVYACKEGSVAAPTAGFHFTQDILNALTAKGVTITQVTLHVGPGTFLPVRVNDIQQHKMHTEFYSLSKECCGIIDQAKKDGRRVTAVGTTTTRVLESVARKHACLKPEQAATDIFIYPPYGFQIIDRLITNFHLPKSTLLMLVAAFAGRETILAAYKEAIDKKYRLFSYGDAMLVE